MKIPKLPEPPPTESMDGHANKRPKLSDPSPTESSDKPVKKIPKLPYPPPTQLADDEDWFTDWLFRKIMGRDK